VWHASALGVYSDESSENTVGETYLRGIQLTDSNGEVTFTSIYPGWYSGRTNHIHVRVYTGGTVSDTGYDYGSATLIWTGQMFFDPDLNTEIAATSPYDTNTVSRTTNAEDRVYTEQHGSEVLATTTGNSTDGYVAASSYTMSGGGTSTGTDTTTLTLTSSMTSVKHGEKVTLSGKLTDSTTSSGLSSKTVTLHATTPSGKTVSTTTKTGTGGAWSMTIAPEVTATYRAKFAATSGHARAVSPSVKVPVHYRVAITDVSGTAAAAKPIVASGTVSPVSRGRHVIVHKIVDGKRHTLIRVRTNGKGHWSAAWHMPTGKHEVVATVPATTNEAGGVSRTIIVRRT
jgi:hypothetical protein